MRAFFSFLVVLVATGASAQQAFIIGSPGETIRGKFTQFWPSNNGPVGNVTVTFQPGVYSPGETIDLPYNVTLDIFFEEGAYIDCQGSPGLSFNAYNAETYETVTLHNIAVIGCRRVSNSTRVNGGALYSYQVNRLRVRGGLFANNSASSSLRAEGGAAFIQQTDKLVFSQVYFYSNLAIGAEAYGGALKTYDVAFVEIDNCTFTANGVGGTNDASGGAISLVGADRGVARLIQVYFFYNEVHGTDARGGAIEAINFDLINIRQGCIFASNKADSTKYSGGAFGGAVHIYRYGLVLTVRTEISESFFYSNNCVAMDGALGGALSSDVGVSWTIAASVFAFNVADYGGALYAEDSTSLNCTVFSTNYARRFASAIYMWRDAQRELSSPFLHVQDSLVYGGQSYTSGAAAIHVEADVQSFDLSNISMPWVSRTRVKFLRSNLTDNVGHGLKTGSSILSVRGLMLELEDSVIVSNNLTRSSGASVDALQSSTVIVRTLISSNAGMLGGITCARSMLDVTNSSVFGNAGEDFNCELCSGASSSLCNCRGTFDECTVCDGSGSGCVPASGAAPLCDANLVIPTLPPTNEPVNSSTAFSSSTSASSDSSASTGTSTAASATSFPTLSTLATTLMPVSGASTTPDVTPLESTDSGSFPIFAVIGAVAGIACVILIFTAAFFLRRLHGSKRPSSTDDISLEESARDSVNAASQRGSSVISTASSPSPAKRNSGVTSASSTYLSQKGGSKELFGIQTDKILGKGAFGEVLHGFWDGTEVACKSANESASRDELLAEASLLTGLRHANIVLYLGHYVDVDKDELLLVFEFAEHGSVLQYLEQTKVDLGGKVRMLVDAAKGMAYLAKSQVVHRDLSCRNLLVAAGGVVKISDFGLSRSTDHYYTTSGGAIPVRWSAPEVLRQGTSSILSDVFSFGITMWELLSDGTVPFVGETNAAVSRFIIEGAAMDHLERPTVCTTELYELIGKCVPVQASDRLSMREILEELQRIATTLQVVRGTSSQGGSVAGFLTDTSYANSPPDPSGLYQNDDGGSLYGKTPANLLYQTGDNPQETYSRTPSLARTYSGSD